MLEDSLESFICTVFQFITSKSNTRHSGIIRKHSETLHELGEFSFPAQIKPWASYISREDYSEDTTSIHELFQKRCQSDFVKISAAWYLNINSFTEKHNRIYLFLNRVVAAKKGILQCMKNSVLIDDLLTKKIINVIQDVSNKSVDSLVNFRVLVTSNVIKNLSTLCCLEDTHMQDILVTWNLSREAQPGCGVVLCGPVLNVNTGLKETKITAQDYIEKRQSEMSLIAQHRYGVRATGAGVAAGDARWSALVRRLGEAAVMFELLQVRPRNPVKVNFNHSTAGCSKGAAFVLYNCARLETLVATFQQRVDSGQYPPPPDIDHTDFALLTDEDEWSLLFNSVLGFPSVVRGCFRCGGDGEGCVAAPHQLCAFLSSMVLTFSRYYRRVRILTEAREHLMPVLFARMRLLGALNQTLHACLKILNMPAVSRM